MMLPLKLRLEVASRRRSQELCVPHQRYWALFPPVNLSKNTIVLLVVVSYIYLSWLRGHVTCSDWLETMGDKCLC